MRLRFCLPNTVRHWAEYQPHKPAMITDQGVLTYRQLDELADEIVRRLGGGHCTEAVAILINDKALFVAALVGVLRTGRYAVMLASWATPNVLMDIQGDAGFRAVVTDLPGESDAVKCLANRGVRIVRADKNVARACVQLTNDAVRDAEGTWGVFYTSGTTSRPKGIVRSDISVLMELIGWCFELPITRNTIFYIGRPLFYTGGLVLAAATVLAGGTVVAPNLTDVSTYWQMCRDHSVTFAFFIPDQVRDLLRAAASHPPLHRGAATILTMGAPIDVETKLEICKRLGCQFIESWGNSEGLGTITCPDDVLQRPKSIGKPFVTDSMIILDEDGHALPPGHVGLIAGRADSRLREYQNRSDLNDALIREDLVISEDLGFVDAEGYFFLAGRKSERIMRRGIPIFASDIEPAFRSIRGISEVVVVGRPDKHEGQVPVALIEQAENATVEPDKVMMIANEKLEAHLKVVSVIVVERFERNPAGKILLDVARKLAV